MRFICVILTFLVGFAGFDTQATAACKNKVGGVCIDKQPSTPAKKPNRKKTKKKSTQPKKTTAPVKAPVVKRTAESCIVVAENDLGLDGNSLSRIKRYVFRNTCERSVYVYVTPSPCFRASDPNSSSKRQQVLVKPKKRKSVEMRHPEKIYKRGKSAFAAKYSFEKAGYPKWVENCG